MIKRRCGSRQSDLPASPRHPFYTRLNAILEAESFDRFVEDQCRQFYAPVMGRPSLAPRRYFRLLLIGYFEGIDAERGIVWRAADSLAVRTFLRLGLEEGTPEHSTIARTRRLIDVETHRAVFTWIQQRLVAAALLKGRTIAVGGGRAEQGPRTGVTLTARQPSHVSYRLDRSFQRQRPETKLSPGRGSALHFDASLPYSKSEFGKHCPPPGRRRTLAQLETEAADR